MNVLQTAILTGVAFCCSAWSQATPNSNALLTGAYNFRQVSYYVSNPLGTLSRSTVSYGTITFDGNGNYSIAGSLLDSTVVPQAVAPLTKTGTYVLGASGQGTLSGPVSSTDLVYVLVSNGIVVGSSTSSNFNDLFIAAPATPSATVATLNGAYSMASLNFPSTDPTAAMSAWFTVTADGKGNVTPLAITGHSASAASTLVTQILPATVPYTFTGGVGTLTFPVNTAAGIFLSGPKTLYASPDGKFVFGGSATGWDMLIGVNTVTPPPSTLGFTGLYYQAGLDQDVSALASGTTTLAGYYGSLNTSNHLTVAHQHLNSEPISTPYDYTFADTYTANSDGSVSDPLLQATYVLGSNGIRIGYDTGTALGINVAIPATTLTGTGVFLNPQGVVNAASFAPFTAGIAPGELVTLFGSGLSATTASASATPIATTLSNVQVLINGTPAPVAYVSPGAVTVIAPYTLSTATSSGSTSLQPQSATIQVVNNGVASDTISTYVRTTSPGVFTVPADGIGYAAALHLDYSLVTTSSPVAAGETIALFVEGLGLVSPSIAAGAVGPTSPLSVTPANTIGVLVDNQLATVSYAGLAPGFAGLYQINVQIPASGIHSGDVSIAIAGPDSLSAEAKITVAAGTGTIPPTGKMQHSTR